MYSSGKKKNKNLTKITTMCAFPYDTIPCQPKCCMAVGVSRLGKINPLNSFIKGITKWNHAFKR